MRSFYFMKQCTLFTLSLMAILLIYINILGEIKTIQLIVDEYLLIVSIFPLACIWLVSRLKVKKYNITLSSQAITLKSTVLFFLFFEVIDYYSEDGFTGMISQWFLYWIMGLLSLLVIEIINNIKIYKLVKIKNQESL